MMRMAAIGACVVIVGTVVVSVFSGQPALFGLLSPTSSASATLPRTGLLGMEIKALTRQGISPERALDAIYVQGDIAQAGLVKKVETAMGNRFAGMWFEPATAQLHVGVASSASKRAAAAVAARAGLAPNVVETPVRSTWAQLQATQARWNSRLADLFARGRVKTGLDPEGNAVLVVVSASVPRARLNALKRRASTSAVKVDVRVVPSTTLDVSNQSPSTSCNRFEAQKAFCNASLTSGVTIQNEAKENCTAGPMMIPKQSKNETYVLTAGHCMEKPGGIGSKWFAFNRAGTKAEIGPAVEWVNATKADVGAIRIANTSWQTGNSKDPVLAVTAEWTKEAREQEVSYPVIGERAPMQGATSCHEGQTSGQSCGPIMTVGVAATFEGILTEGLVEVLGATSGGGDSGGPWMFINGSKSALMEGVHKGAGASELYFVPLILAYRALTKLNLELLTTANENRP